MVNAARLISVAAVGPGHIIIIRKIIWLEIPGVVVIYMDEIDNKILNKLQKGLPITEKPFARLACQLGLETDEILDRLGRLKKQGYIRRFGGVFDSGKLGYQSTLIALKIEEEYFAEIAGKVSSYQGVTHCYRRDDPYNLWFTLTVNNENIKHKIIAEIKRCKGVESLFDLPRKRSFKLKVFFEMGDRADVKIN